MTEIYASDGTRMREVTMTLKLLVRDDETEQMARDVRRVLASRKALRRLLTSIVGIGVEGPGMLTRQPVYQCHECCPPGEPCPCDARPDGEDEFCDCDHGYAECPGCAVALAPGAAHAEGCEWLAGVQAGMQARREGRMIPLSEVKRELGIEDAPQRDNPPEDMLPAPTPGAYGDGLHHTHTCPKDDLVFPCGAEHPRDETLLQGEVVALCPYPHRGKPLLVRP